MKVRAIRKRSLALLGNWIRFKNRWDLWGTEGGVAFADMDDAIDFLFHRHTVMKEVRRPLTGSKRARSLARLGLA